ncbi:hypothetical protein [Bacillus sp. 1P02SD]|uniref:hypothetical protein n=1 Tax=Bacillus sp. 1P02SD TaxID=3132264 RepID=UPI0039A2D26E
MKVGLISATKVSLEPIESAFHKESPEIEVFHYLDSSLLPMLKDEGYLSPKIMKRFIRLIDSAVDSEVDVILLTCSAFNDLVEILKPLYQIQIFRSDEAVLDSALAYERIGLLSTVHETSTVLMNYLKKKNPNVSVVPMVEDGLIFYLNSGMIKEHDERVIEMINEISKEVDVIVLAQFSMEHVADQVNFTIPILTAPRLAAKRCKDYISDLH